MSALGCQIKNALRNQALLILARLWSHRANQKDVRLIITALRTAQHVK